MLCEHYKDALIEAAATGAAPQGELRAHLTECAACRASFAQEQSLFAAIDSGLYAAANTQVPPSLLPRVRGSLEGVLVGRRHWVQTLAFASAGVALALVVFLVARPPHRTPENVAEQGAVAAPAAVTPTESTHPEEIPSIGTQIASVRRNRSHTAGNSTIPHSAASSSPEVLVPPDEREAFARFLGRDRALATPASVSAARAPKAPQEFVEILPVEIASLTVTPLSKDEDDGQQREF